MALLNLYIKPLRKIGIVIFDVTVTEVHDRKVRLTKNPIEQGADITDHAIIEPKRISIQAAISDTPFNVGTFVEAIVDRVTSLVGSSTTNGLTRSKQGYKDLIEVMETREPITIQTNLVSYENMVITSVNVSQDKDTSKIVILDIMAEEAILTQTEIISLSAESLSTSAATQSSSAVQRGRIETIPLAAGSPKNVSVLKKITNFATGSN